MSLPLLSFDPFDSVEIASREIYKTFLKDGQLPADKLIEAACETKCSRCGHVIKKGAKLMVASYTYYPPRNLFITYVIAPPRIPKTGYKILCEECSKDSTIKGVAKETWKKIFGIFR
ncbi:hypothetical protein AGMMS49957_11460 [Synergistales bacterium]|nr:hypothetical protein AGMMS49957_11460 [Synergistales bacterium]